MQRALSHNTCYASQVRRINCKLCNAPLIDVIDFTSHNVEYQFCRECSHLNGLYTDSEEYVRALYVNDDGKEYAFNYLDAKYEERIGNIYGPKIDFFVDSTDVPVKSLLDVGCGGGHLVYAALQKGLIAKGVDVNKTLIDYGNFHIQHKFGCSPLSVAEEKGLYDLIIESDVDVISAVAIFEHLRHLELFFDAFKRSSAKILYYAVPMYSLSVVLENIFPEVFPRHLSGGHTHLFTEKSLLKLNELLGVEPVAEWRFGTDFMDLYRSLMITVKNNSGSEFFLEMLSTGIKPNIDELQSVLDRNHYCSQIHCVCRKL